MDRAEAFARLLRVDTGEINLFDLYQLFGNEELAYNWFVETRWPNGIACPRCGNLDVKERDCHPTQPFHCPACKRFFSVKVNTIMHGSKLPYRKWLMAMHLFVTYPKGISAKQLEKHLGVSYKTAWHLGHRLREAMKPTDKEVFDGPVEVDETWIGGRLRNQRMDRRAMNKKVSIVGMIDRATNRVIMKPVRAATQTQLQPFVYQHTHRNTPVFTDESRAYFGLLRYHQTVNHSQGEYGLTNRIEGVWVLLTRAYKGTYHLMSPKHLHRYATEFAERHNRRKLPDLYRMWSVVWSAEKKRLRYEDLIG